MQALARPHSWRDALMAIDALEVRWNAPLAARTSFRIGGRAEALVVPASLEAVEQLTLLASAHHVPLTVLGGGTNVLVADDGVDGIIVDLRPSFDFLLEQAGEAGASQFLAGAGCPTARLVTLAAARALSGAEALAGIPGTIGGALVMNAGGHEGDIGALVQRVQLVVRGKTAWLTAAQAQFGYRHSNFPSGAILTAAELKLARAGDATSVAERVRALIARRRASQPLALPNAGSIFKNPAGDFAGRLIEAAGCKGWSEGDAHVSEVHANFIVNAANASAAQVARLVARVRERVRAHSGVELQLELRLLGRFGKEVGL